MRESPERIRSSACSSSPSRQGTASPQYHQIQSGIMEAAAHTSSSFSEERSGSTPPLHEHPEDDTAMCDCEPQFAHVSREMLKRIEEGHPASVSAIRSSLEGDPEHRNLATQAQSHNDAAGAASDPSKLRDTSVAVDLICQMLMILARIPPLPPFEQYQIKGYIRALHLVQHVLQVYPPYEGTAKETQHITRLGNAFASFLKRDGQEDLWNFWVDIVTALDGHRDVLSKFRAYMMKAGFRADFWSQDNEPKFWESWHKQVDIEAWLKGLEDAGLCGN